MIGFSDCLALRRGLFVRDTSVLKSSYVLNIDYVNNEFHLQ